MEAEVGEVGTGTATDADTSGSSGNEERGQLHWVSCAVRDAATPPWILPSARLNDNDLHGPLRRSVELHWWQT